VTRGFVEKKRQILSKNRPKCSLSKKILPEEITDQNIEI
jgi:hypothetical protein